MIADDQTLRHAFVLKNPWDRDVHVLQAFAASPCCSSIEPASILIPRRSTLDVPVTFRPGVQAGKRRVDFLVATDAPGAERVALTLTVDLAAAWELVPLSEFPISLPMGQAGSVEMEVVCRRSKGQGLSLPDRVEAAGLEASLARESDDARDAGGLLVSRRMLTLGIPASAEPGSRQAEVAFVWNDGRRRTQPIPWRVRPWIRATPSAVILDDAAREVDVRLEAESTPFRVTGVSGATFVPAADEPRIGGTVQTVRLAIPSAEAGATGLVREISIVTDHPRQRAVALTVVLPPRSEASR